MYIKAESLQTVNNLLDDNYPQVYRQFFKEVSFLFPHFKTSNIQTWMCFYTSQILKARRLEIFGEQVSLHRLLSYARF